MRLIIFKQLTLIAKVIGFDLKSLYDYEIDGKYCMENLSFPIKTNINVGKKTNISFVSGRVFKYSTFILSNKMNKSYGLLQHSSISLF